MKNQLAEMLSILITPTYDQIFTSFSENDKIFETIKFSVSGYCLFQIKISIIKKPDGNNV